MWTDAHCEAASRETNNSILSQKQPEIITIKKKKKGLIIPGNTEKNPCFIHNQQSHYIKYSSWNSRAEIR